MPQRTIKTKYYTFRQNNSGGRWRHEPDVDLFVILEAVSAEDANRRACEVGIYFDGFDRGDDCGCCGDRWSRVDETDGSDTPVVYGRPASEWSNEEIEMYAKGACIVHHMDGTKDRFPFKGSKSQTDERQL